MSLFFLPIDIDIENIKINALDSNQKSKSRQHWWDSTNITKTNSVDSIIEQLPFEQLTLILHKIQQSAANPHIDEVPEKHMIDKEYDNIINNQPAGYRIVLKGKQDSLKVFDGKQWKIAMLPQVPCCYVLNSVECYHRVDEDIDRETLYFRGILDITKHNYLIQKSLEKYQDYAIYKNE